MGILILPRKTIFSWSFSIDSPSALPYGITTKDLLGAYYMRSATPSNNITLTDHWMEDVWVGAAGEGWLYSYVNILKNRRDNTYLGVYYPLSFISSYSQEILKNKSERLILLSPSTVVLSTSKLVNNDNLFKIIDDYDYLEQLKANPSYGNEFKLTHNTQSPEIQRLGNEILKGEKEIIIYINGKRLFFYVKEIIETGFYLIGYY